MKKVNIFIDIFLSQRQTFFRKTTRPAQTQAVATQMKQNRSPKKAWHHQRGQDPPTVGGYLLQKPPANFYF